MAAERAVWAKTRDLTRDNSKTVLRSSYLHIKLATTLPEPRLLYIVHACALKGVMFRNTRPILGCPKANPTR